MIKLSPRKNELNIKKLNQELLNKFKKQEIITINNTSYQCFNGVYTRVYTRGL